MAACVAAALVGLSASASAQEEPPPEPAAPAPAPAPAEPPAPAPQPAVPAAPARRAAPPAPAPAPAVEEEAAPQGAQSAAQADRLPSAPPAAPSVPVSAPYLAPNAREGGFTFGSYGRTVAATDFTGRPGRDADIVARGSRLDESNYVELSLVRGDYWEKTDTWTRVVVTVATAHPVFHYNGVFDAQFAVRNLFLEASDVGVKGLSVWAGSRMYRGDDIYLLDWWPLDNLNTLGGGVKYAFSDHTTGALQAGVSKPNGPFFGQAVDRPAPLNQIGATPVDVLQRQKFIGSAKATHVIPLEGGAGIKGVAYGELHQLPSGQRQTDPGFFESLPADSGYVVGGQIGAYTGERGTHVNLFLRYARGLAAYGEFSTPVQLAPDRTASGAHELIAALGGNWEHGPFGVMFAGYLRNFRNASPDLDAWDVDEGIVIARPHVFFGELGGLAVEGSYQAQQRGVLFTESAPAGALTVPTGPNTASLVRFGVMPFLSPSGIGDYSRPHLRLIYAVTLRDDAARKLYAQDDVFSLRKTEHFFGFGAEWWFNTPN